MINLHHGDCLEVMDALIEQGVTVDAIITDPPYGTTACKWDSVIPFDAMWERLNKLIKPNGAIVLFGSEPFSSLLRVSNIKNYKYDWVWEKSRATGFLNSKKQPLRAHENILLFYKTPPPYFPQMSQGEPYTKNMRGVPKENMYGSFKPHAPKSESGDRFPRSVLYFKTSETEPNKGLHPTQKPVALMEYLIKTYTHEGEMVLDFTMGSGTTGVACINTGMGFIGIERDDAYFEIAKQRIEEAQNQYPLFKEAAS